MTLFNKLKPICLYFYTWIKKISIFCKILLPIISVLGSLSLFNDYSTYKEQKKNDLKIERCQILTQMNSHITQYMIHLPRAISVVSKYLSDEDKKKRHDFSKISTKVEKNIQILNSFFNEYLKYIYKISLYFPKKSDEMAKLSKVLQAFQTSGSDLFIGYNNFDFLKTSSANNYIYIQNLYLASSKFLKNLGELSKVSEEQQSIFDQHCSNLIKLD